MGNYVPALLKKAVTFLVMCLASTAWGVSRTYAFLEIPGQGDMTSCWPQGPAQVCVAFLCHTGRQTLKVCASRTVSTSLPKGRKG